MGGGASVRTRLGAKTGTGTGRRRRAQHAHKKREKLARRRVRDGSVWGLAYRVNGLAARGSPAAEGEGGANQALTTHPCWARGRLACHRRGGRSSRCCAGGSRRKSWWAPWARPWTACWPPAPFPLIASSEVGPTAAAAAAGCCCALLSGTSMQLPFFFRLGPVLCGATLIHAPPTLSLLAPPPPPHTHLRRPSSTPSARVRQRRRRLRPGGPGGPPQGPRPPRPRRRARLPRPVPGPAPRLPPQPQGLRAHHCCVSHVCFEGLVL